MRELYLDDLAVGGKFATGSVILTVEGCRAFAAEFEGEIKIAGGLVGLGRNRPIPATRCA